MTVRDLIDKLRMYDQDLEVITDEYSDYTHVTTVGGLKGVNKGDWIMRSHSSMSEDNKKNEQLFLYIGP